MSLMRILDRTIDELQRKAPNLPPDLESQKGKKTSSEFQQQLIHFQPKQHLYATSVGAIFIAEFSIARIGINFKLIANVACIYTSSSTRIPYRQAAPQSHSM